VEFGSFQKRRNNLFVLPFEYASKTMNDITAINCFWASLKIKSFYRKSFFNHIAIYKRSLAIHKERVKLDNNRILRRSQSASKNE